MMSEFRRFDPRIVSGQFDPSEGLFTFVLERKLTFTMHEQRTLQASMLDFLRRVRTTPALRPAATPFPSRAAAWADEQNFPHYFEAICLPVYVVHNMDADPAVSRKMIGNRLFTLIHFYDVTAAVAYRLRWNSSPLPENWQTLCEKGISAYCVPRPPFD